ncbi:MAG: 1-phosphofructokinase family hexose kinase [Armatimonadetes bacterium]|nr:1-phosphofructokinase family hexose kinase [Armatimonadota bacterium]
MILTVTLNAAIDKTLRVDRFSVNGRFHPAEVVTVPGGKGINVARVLSRLGAPVLATGFVGGHNGEFICDHLDREGIPQNFVKIREESRLCFAVADPVFGNHTEVDELGPSVSADELDLLMAHYENLLDKVSLVILSGSLPRGIPVSIYREMAKVASQKGKTIFLDAAGEALSEGLKAAPKVVKPNREEMEDYLGRAIGDPAELLEPIHRWHEMGVETVIVSLGREGAIASNHAGCWRLRPPPIRILSPVGSGDAMLAAYAYGTLSGNEFLECAKLSVGAGAANAAHYGAGFVLPEEVFDLSGRVEISRWR